MNFKQIAIPINVGGIVLMFKQYQNDGDWICMASDECIKDIELLTKSAYAAAIKARDSK